MLVDVTKLNENAQIPTRGSEHAAGYDLYACDDAIIPAGSNVLIGTGIALAIPEGYFGGVYARSGLSVKEGLRPANCVGVIDSDYRGEVKVALYNDSSVEKTIKSGERIAQLVVQPFLGVEFSVVDKLSDTERGAGGFGSTGKN